MTDFIIKYRWFIIAMFITTGTVSLLIIPGIKTDPDIRNYIPKSIGSRAETDKIESEFGVQDMIMILFSDGTMVSRENLDNIRKIDRSVSRISGVGDRISPFTVKSIKSEEGMMVVEPLIRIIPSDTAGQRRLGKEISENRFAENIVFSHDLTSAAITATLSNMVPERLNLQKIDSVINTETGNLKILRGGLPYIRKYLLEEVNRDAIILIPAALVIMLMVLKASLGTWHSVLLPFGIVFVTTALSMALIPLLGWKMSIITVLVPVILIAVANNYGIYLVARFQELVLRYPDLTKKELIRLLLGTLNMPILFSGLTTISGLLGLMMHSIIPARQTGILAAAGVSAALLMSLIVVPVMIYVNNIDKFIRKKKTRTTERFEKFLGMISEIIIARNGLILAVSLSIVIMSGSGILLIKINTNQENYFSDKHPVREASKMINSRFGGSQTISVMIESDILDPGVLNGIDNITKWTESQDGVGNVFSISQIVREMSKVIYTKDEYGYDRIPDTREGIAQMFELYNMSGNPEDYRRLLNPSYTKAHILIKLARPENDVIKLVKSGIGELSKGFPGKVTTGGYALIMTDFANSIIRGQIFSLLFAVVTVFLLLSIVFRSFKGGITGSVPLIASIIVLLGFMGFSGIELDAATALLSSIMIGVGVDFTIQFIWCYNLTVNSGLSFTEAVPEAMRTIGRSIIINALVVMSGFAALIFSGFTSIRFFGYLVIISIGSCLLGALIVIPAILVRYRPGFIGFKTNKTSENEKTNVYAGYPSATVAGVGTKS
jgi:predicted RND superfamily exporter protein